jgi:TadE-like protein
MSRLPDIRKEDGQSLVEFALVLPVLLLIVTGILYFGLMFNQKMSTTDAARIGARALALDRGQSGDVCAAVESNLIQSEPTLNLTHANFPAPQFSNANDNCTNAQSWLPGDTVTFFISKNFTFSQLFLFKPFTVGVGAQVTEAIE